RLAFVLSPLGPNVVRQVRHALQEARYQAAACSFRAALFPELVEASDFCRDRQLLFRRLYRRLLWLGRAWIFEVVDVMADLVAEMEPFAAHAVRRKALVQSAFRPLVTWDRMQDFQLFRVRRLERLQPLNRGGREADLYVLSGGDKVDVAGVQSATPDRVYSCFRGSIFRLKAVAPVDIVGFW